LVSAVDGVTGPPGEQDRGATRVFFAPRAATWEERFPDDDPVYQAAVADLRPPAGGTVLDIACGTGRVLPFLRAAVGPDGRVLAVDLTPEMLEAARAKDRHRVAALVLGDGLHLPLPAGAIDAVFAAGYLSHVPDSATALAELARVTRPGGRLAVFHPVSRAALAARQGRDLSPDDPLDPAMLAPALTATGWRPESFDDGPDRYLALAVRS
jgi:SAM-dependent methyltransferase